MVSKLLLVLLVLAIARTGSAQYPAPAERDFVLENYRFRSSERLPELPRRLAGAAVLGEVAVPETGRDVVHRLAQLEVLVALDQRQGQRGRHPPKLSVALTAQNCRLRQ